MTVFETDDAYAYPSQDNFFSKNTYVCAVCEREILAGEACYCFEDNPVCENCCSEYVMDHYWYATPNDI